MSQLKDFEIGDRVLVCISQEGYTSGWIVADGGKCTMPATILAKRDDKVSISLTKDHPGFVREHWEVFDTCKCEAMPETKPEVKMTTLADAKVGDRIHMYAIDVAGSKQIISDKTDITLTATVVEVTLAGDYTLAWRENEESDRFASAITSYPGFVKARFHLGHWCECEILPPEAPTASKKTLPILGVLTLLATVLTHSAKQPKPMTRVESERLSTEDDLADIEVKKEGAA